MRFKINYDAIQIAAILRTGGINGYLGSGGYLEGARTSAAPVWSTQPTVPGSFGDPGPATDHSEPYLGSPRFIGEVMHPSIGGLIGSAWRHWGIEAVTAEHRQRLVDGLHPVSGEKVVRASRGKAEYTPIHELVFTIPKELSLFLDRPEVAEGLRLGMVRVFQDIEDRAVAAGHRDPLPVVGLAGEWWLHFAGRGADGQKPEAGKGGVPHMHIHVDIFAVAPLHEPRTHAVGRKSKRHPERVRKTKTTDHGRFDARRAFANQEDGPRLEALLAGTVIEHLRKSGWTLAPPPIGECPGVGLVGWTIIAPDGRRPTQSMVQASSPRRIQIDQVHRRQALPKTGINARKRIMWARRYSEFLISTAQVAPPLIGIGSNAQYIRNAMKEIQHERQFHEFRTRTFARTGRFPLVSSPGPAHVGRPHDAGLDPELFGPAIGRIEKPLIGRIAGWAGELPGPSVLGHALQAGTEDLGRQDHSIGSDGPSHPAEHDLNLGGPGDPDLRPRPSVRFGVPGLPGGLGGSGWNEAGLHSASDQPGGGDHHRVRPGDSSQGIPGEGLDPRGVGGWGRMEGEAPDAAIGGPLKLDALRGMALASISDRVLAYASSDADALGYDLPSPFAWDDRVEQISLAAEIVALERQDNGWKPESPPVSEARGIIRLESWEASASAQIPVESWPRLRSLAHRPLRNLNPKNPEIGEVRVNASKDLWVSFRDAAKAAVAWLGRQLGISLPGQGSSSAVSKTSVPDPAVEVKPYALTPEMLDVLEVPPALPTLGPRFETPQEGDAWEHKKRVGHMKPDVEAEIYQPPRWKLPGRR